MNAGKVNYFIVDAVSYVTECPYVDTNILYLVFLKICVKKCIYYIKKHTLLKNVQFRFLLNWFEWTQIYY